MTAMKAQLQTLIEQKIGKWQRDDIYESIYAISLYVYAEEDDPRRPVAVLGYNTRQQVQQSTPLALDEQEAKWNYAFWLQNEELCFGLGDTAETVRQWIDGLGLEDEEEIAGAFEDMLIQVVREIHASGLLRDMSGRELPILIHGLEYDEHTGWMNREANLNALDQDFLRFCGLARVHDSSSAPRYSFSNRADVPRKFYVGEKKADMRHVIAFILIIISVMSMLGIYGILKDGSAAAPETEESGQEESALRWQVYIHPDVPEPLAEILLQYEQAMNAGSNSKIPDDVKIELYFNWYDAVEAGKTPPIYYSLCDLTGDGFPELIMGDGLDVRIVYYCGETGDIQFKEDSGKYGMTLYEGGIIEYASGSTVSYWQFSREEQDWIIVESLECIQNQENVGELDYYRRIVADEVNGEKEKISQEEYHRIIEQYTQREVELEWFSLCRPD